jgi:hypothetical protein
LWNHLQLRRIFRRSGDGDLVRLEGSAFGVFSQDYLWLLASNYNFQADPGFDIEVAYGSGNGSDVPVVGNWTRVVPPANASPDSFNVTVNGTSQGSNGSAAPGTPAQFTMTFHDPVNGSGDIMLGDLYFSNVNGAGGNTCYLEWYRSTYSGYTNVYLLDNHTQSDSLCTISPGWTLTNNPSDLGAAILKLNITFTTAALGSYTVNSMVYDQSWNSTGWSQVGTFVVGNPLVTTTTNLANGYAGQPYSASFAAQGGQPPYIWSLASGTLPSGLTLSTGGILSGTPNTGGAYNQPDPVTGVTNVSFTISVTDTAGASATTSPSLYIQLPLQLSTASNPGCQQITVMSSTKVGLVRGTPGNATPPTFDFDSNGNGSGPSPADPNDRVDNFLPPSSSGGSQPGDVAVIGDWTGDGQSKAGWFRPSTGEWFLDANNNGVFDAGDLHYTGFGGAGDVPVIGDWAGLGRSAIGVVHIGYQWMLDLNADGIFQGPNGATGDAVFAFGSPGIGAILPDVPVVGNWFGRVNAVTGKPISQAGAVRPFSNSGIPTSAPALWLLDSGLPGTVAGNVVGGVGTPTPQSGHAIGNLPGIAFGGSLGTSPDIPVVGDWFNLGRTQFGDFAQGFLWVLDGTPAQSAQAAQCNGGVFAYGGLAGDKPITGNWGPPPGFSPIPLTFTSNLSTNNADTATFTASWSDPTGNATTDLEFVQMAFATPPTIDYETTVNSCALKYFPGSATLYLEDADGSGSFKDSSAIGSTGQSLYNGVCIIDTAHTMFSTSGGTATLTAPVTFANPKTTYYSMFTSATSWTNGFEPWVDFGEWTAPAIQFPGLSVQISDLTQNTPIYYAGDNFRLTVSGPPNLPVTRDRDGVLSAVLGSTNSAGVYSTTAAWTSSDVGVHLDTYYLGGYPVTPTNMLLDILPALGTPGGPVSQPNSMTATLPVLDCADISGNWIVQDNFGQQSEWDLTQSGTQVSGTIYFSNNPQNCGIYTWNLSGQLNNDGTFIISGQQPDLFDYCGLPLATSVTENNLRISGSSCSSGSANWQNNLNQIPNSGTATWAAKQAGNAVSSAPATPHLMFGILPTFRSITYRAHAAAGNIRRAQATSARCCTKVTHSGAPIARHNPSLRFRA